MTSTQISWKNITDGDILSGQVVALFIVGLGEYGVVWLGTDWDKEIERGIERNRREAKQRLLDSGSEGGRDGNE